MTSPFDDPEFRRQMAEMGVQHQPGMAKRMLDQIAPLLAAEGIDLENMNGSDLDAVNAALARATELHNLMLFTPVGKHRSLALRVLHRFTMAIGDDDLPLAQGILGGVPIEETDTMPAISHVIGVALGLLDTRHTDPALASARQRMRVPVWPDKQAAAASRDIVPLSNKGRAFDALDRLIARYGGERIMIGAALAVAASVLAQARTERREVAELAASVFSDGEADAVAPAAPTGAAFRRGGNRTDGEALALEFQSWLGLQDDIATSDVEFEIHMFRTLLQLAHQWQLDLRDPEDVEDFIGMLCEADADAGVDGSEETLTNALETLDDYVHMRIEVDAEPLVWAGAHQVLEEQLQFGEDDSAAVLQDALSSGLEIPEDERHAALKRLPVVAGVSRLMEWLGSGRAVSATGSLRRAEIQQVAAMIGIRAVGVNRRMRSTGGVAQVMSMGELPLLTAWWSALNIAAVTELTATRVRPGGSADAWLGETTFEVAEFLAGLVAAEIITDAYFDLDDDDEHEVVTDTVARVVAALGDGADAAFELSDMRMRTLEQAGYLERDADGAWIVPDALRSTVARAVMMVFATHLMPGVVDGFIDELGGAE
ncbi:hypothetical protein [Microbacterium sp.]|uniref:hypothetical protein n=1 Tax=Microbacterium sp. TaxID=51671 RepID=UPI003C72BF06